MKRLNFLFAFLPVLSAALAGESLEFKALFDFKGGTSVAFYSPRVAFFGSRGAILRLDISNLESPVFSEVPLNPGPKGAIYDIFIQGDTLFLAQGDKGVSFWCISSRMFLGSFKPPGEAVGIAVKGDRAFVADIRGGLWVFDLSWGRNPLLLKGFSTGPGAYSLLLRDSLLLLSLKRGGLEIIRVLDDSLLSLSRLKGNGEIWRVGMEGNIAYVAEGTDGLRILDIKNPRKPKQLASVKVKGSVRDLALFKGRVYLASLSEGIVEVDVKKPRHPKILRVVAGPEVTGRLAISDSLLVALDLKSGIFLYLLR